MISLLQQYLATIVAAATCSGGYAIDLQAERPAVRIDKRLNTGVTDIIAIINVAVTSTRKSY
jgi:hypothetical protein